MILLDPTKRFHQIMTRNDEKMNRQSFKLISSDNNINRLFRDTYGDCGKNILSDDDLKHSDYQWLNVPFPFRKADPVPDGEY